MKNKIYFKTKYSSPIGKLTLVCDDKESLAGLWIEGQKYFGCSIDAEIIENNSLETFKKAKSWLDRYFMGRKPEISELSLAPIGNNFRQQVWQILCKIPYGKTVTYGEIARIIAKENGKEKMSAQAVGNAIGHNPISIIIPCHRVVGANGSLTGYAGGIETKIKLLKHEQTDISHFFIPKTKQKL